jgi:hypothetical protein
LKGNGILVPDHVIIEGAESGFNELSSLLSYAANSGGGGGGGKPLLIDFILKSSDVFDVPNINSVSISEISFSKEGDLKLDISAANINISADQRIPIEKYLEMQIESVDIKIGSAGRINLDLAFTPFTDIKIDFRDLSIADMLGAFKISFDMGGRAAGIAHIELSERGMSASGGLILDELVVSGVPVSSFSSLWKFNDIDNILLFPKISATMRGMENLEGWASINIQSTKGAFFLSGEKLSLSDIEKTFKLGYPVEGENGSFRAKMEFEREIISGDIEVKIPSVKIEKQKIDDVSIGINLKNGVVEGSFMAYLFGAKVAGSGHFSFIPPYNVSLNSMISGVESSKLVFFVPSMADAFPQGKITADVKLDGTLDSIQVNGTIKSDKFSIYGLNFQKPNISLSSQESGLVNYKITSSGGVVLNSSGQIDFAKQQLSGSGNLAINAGSVPALKGSGVSGTINSNFAISGSFTDPIVEINAKGKKNSYFGTPVIQSSVSIKYSSGMLGIIDSSFQLAPKSFLWVKGNISLLSSEPNIDVYGTVKNFSLERYGINGKTNGQFKISGGVSNAKITGNFSADPTTGGKENLNVKISGTTKAIVIEISDSKIAGGSLNGKGRIGFPEKGSPAVNFDINAVNIRMNDLFEAYKIDSPIGGMFTGKIKVQGTVAALRAELTTQYPLTLNKILLDKLYVKLSAGKGGNYTFVAKALLGDVLDLEFAGSIVKKKDRWSLNLSSNNINVDEIVQIGSPSLRDNFAGSVKLLADIELYPKGKMTYTLEANQLEAFGFALRGLRIPFEYSGDEIKFKIDRGNVGGALIFGGGAIDIAKNNWKASFSIKDIYLEKLAEQILSPRGGKLIGRGEGQFDLHGKLGMFPSVFGIGSFSATNGALMGLKEMEKINKEKKFEFYSINGGFIFNGNDVNITSGTSINAPPNNSLYRYIRFSGPLGINGKRMNLHFSTRIDIDILNILIKAFEGLISFASGSNTTSNPTRAITEKILGIKKKNFSNVTFDVRGSWSDPVLSNLKTDKQMSGVYEWGKKADNDSKSDKKRFSFSINIPVGPGSSDSNVKDNLQQSILDVLFDSVIPEVY